MDIEEPIPISVIDEMIAELSEEQDDTSRMITHAIVTLQLLKARWERIQNGQ